MQNVKYFAIAARITQLLCICFALTGALAAQTDLQVENRANPIGIDVTQPRLSWDVDPANGFQEAYQVRATSGGQVVWDSGRVESGESTGIIYRGAALRSRMPVEWQVRVWPSGNWSDSAVFEMGLLEQSDWSAQWIANGAWRYGLPMPVFARTFAIPKPVARARLYITGLGLYFATLNGHPVTEDILAPGNTRFATRVEYATYDVTSQLVAGDNEIRVEVGNGSYNSVRTPGHYADFVNDFSVPLRIIAQLELTYTDGTAQTISTDEQWRTALGPTTVSTWYGGEEYDARRDSLSWSQAVPISPPAPDTRLTWRAAPPVRVAGTVTPQAITEPIPGTYVFDMGINFAGTFELRVSGPAGTQVTMMIGEQLRRDGTVDQSQIESPVTPVYPVVDRYTLSGKDVETWRPKFEYHGFRYLQVAGLPAPPDLSTITGYILRGANDSAGSFTSSSPMLNQIHQIIDRAIQSNMMSIFTDCPDREKLGWLADMQGIFGSIARNYDIAAFGRTVVRNMADAQIPSGLVPDFAPEYVVYDKGFRDDPNWGDAIILTPWSMYETYGDVRVLETYYPNMQRYFEYLRSKSRDNLLDYGLGDWITPDRTLPVGVTASYAYFESAATLGRIAGVLGRPEDAARYSALASAIRDAFVSRYVGDGHQATYALALDMGADTGLDELIADIRTRGNHVNVGIVALGPLFRALMAAGRDDVIYDIATQTTDPSYGYQVVNGATSLTEAWDGPTGYGSQNHMMLGAIDEWFTAGLAGIRQAAGSTGYRRVEIRPAIVGELQHVYGSYRTPYGLIESEWTRSAGGSVILDVSIPANTDAVVYPPGQAPQNVGPGRWRF